MPKRRCDETDQSGDRPMENHPYLYEKLEDYNHAEPSLQANSKLSERASGTPPVTIARLNSSLQIADRTSNMVRPQSLCASGEKLSPGNDTIVTSLCASREKASPGDETSVTSLSKVVDAIMKKFQRVRMLTSLTRNDCQVSITSPIAATSKTQTNIPATGTTILERLPATEDKNNAKHILDTSTPDEIYLPTSLFNNSIHNTMRKPADLPEPQAFTMNGNVEQRQSAKPATDLFRSVRSMLAWRKATEIGKTDQLIDVATDGDNSTLGHTTTRQTPRAIDAIKRAGLSATEKLSRKFKRNAKDSPVHSSRPSNCAANTFNSGSRIFLTDASKSITSAHIKQDLCDHNYTNSTYPLIGACVVAFPYAMKAAGFPLGILLLICVAIVIDYSQVLLQHSCVMANRTSLQDVMRSVFFKPGWIASLLLPTMYSVSVLVTYNIIIGDCLTKVVHSTLRAAGSKIIIHRRVVITIVTWAIVVPISLVSNVKKVAKWSLMSLLSATLVTVFVCIKLFAAEHVVPVSHNPFRFLNTNLLAAVAILTFALSCQHKFRLSFTAIDQPPTSKRTNSNSQEPHASAVTSYSLLCTLTLAICGYLTFKSVAQGDILENYCEEDAFATVCRTFFSIFIICLYPLECHSVRYLYHGFVGRNIKVDVLYHIAVTLLLVSAAYLVSLILDCLSLALEIAGFLCAIPMVFILPAACYLQLSPGSMCTFRKLPCLLCIAVGFICTVCGGAMMLLTSHQCVHNTRLFPYCNGSSEMLGPLITLMSLNGTWAYEPEFLGLNATGFDVTIDNVTDIAAAYFN